MLTQDIDYIGHIKMDGIISKAISDFDDHQEEGVISYYGTNIL